MYPGWVKVYRKVIQSCWLTNHKLWAFWTWCLLKAAHREHTVIVGHQSVNLLPGQFVFGRKQAAYELCQSEQSIRTHLKFLQKVERNITIQTTNKFSIISIINWDAYQGDNDGINHQGNQLPTTNKNIKKERYGDFVTLTKEEHAKLVNQFGEKGTQDRLAILNSAIGSKGYKYKSHYHTILSWERRHEKAEAKKNILGGLAY